MVAHDTMQPQALALVVLFPVLSTIFVALRVWIRVTMQQFHWGAYSTSLIFRRHLLTYATQQTMDFVWSRAYSQWRMLGLSTTGFNINGLDSMCGTFPTM
jgi:hypothetical protein